MCGGCNFEEFPYEASPPILIGGKYQKRTFNNIDDIWEVIDLLIEEIKDNNNKTGKEFDVANSVNAQLSFFTCRNHLFDKEIQRDFNKYLYCQEFGVPPHKGDYGSQPALWVDK